MKLKQGGGFGFVILIIVVVVVLLLATKAWKALMPTAAQAVTPGFSESVPDHGDEEAGREARSGRLPNLEQMGRSTDAHTQRVNEALEETE